MNTPSNRESFETALADFIDAANDLSSAWQSMPGDAVENYPPFMPSFDEAAAAFAHMRLNLAATRRGADYVSQPGDTFAGEPLTPGTLMRWDASASTHYPVIS